MGRCSSRKVTLTFQTIGFETLKIEDDVLFKLKHGYSRYEKEKVARAAQENEIIRGLMEEIYILDKAEALFNVTRLYKNSDFDNRS
jgi:hypothetical protein